MPPLKVIHIAKSLKSQPQEPKLVKEYVLPSLTSELNKKHWKPSRTQSTMHNNVYKT